MSNVYVDSAAVGLNNGTSWANAFTTLNAALAVATAADTVYMASTHVGVYGASITYIFPAGSGLRIISVDKTSGSPPTVAQAGAVETMGTAAAAGMNMYGFAYIYGVTFQTSSVDNVANTFLVGNIAGPLAIWFDTCKFDVRGTNGSMGVYFGNSGSSSSDDQYVNLKNCVFSRGAATQTIRLRCRVDIVNMSLDPASATPSNLFSSSGGGGTCDVSIVGSDLSNKNWTALFLNSASALNNNLRLYNCRLPSTFTMLGSSTVTNLGGPELYLFNCNIGTVNGYFAYANPCGSLILTSATMFTGSIAGGSWQVATSTLATPTNPFITPWINFRNNLVVPLTPRLEVLRNNGVAAAYDNSQVWSEWTARIAGANDPLAAYYSDGLANPLQAPVAQPAGAGVGAWTIAAPSSPFSYKLEPPVPITPAGPGFIRARVFVGVPSITIRVDPVIRV